MKKLDLSKPISLSVEKLANDFSFLDNPVWCCIDPGNPITLEEVISAIHSNKNLPSKPRRRSVSNHNQTTRNRKYEISRIAYLVKNKDKNPISIDVGFDRDWLHGWDWPIDDGNHRLAAAIVRNDKTILVNFSGLEREIKRAIKRYSPPLPKNKRNSK